MTGTIDHTRGGYNFFSGDAGAHTLNAEVSDLFWDISGALTVTDFYDSGVQDLSAVGSPIVRTGGTQVAADYNAGTNLGSGGGLTKTGNFTDV